jgi:hypothetical protein
MSYPVRLLIGSLCLLLGSGGVARAKTPVIVAPVSAIRETTDSKAQPLAFETALVHFQSVKGPTLSVDLVAAVHFGEVGYYRALNQRFKGYDAVLFEMVAPDDPTDPHRLGNYLRLHQKLRALHPDRAENDNMLSRIQVQLAHLLGLVFQLDLIDYGANNFVHADITPSEFSKSMRDRGESIQQILLRALKSSLADASEPTADDLDELSLLRILFRGPNPHDRIAMRRMLAASFKDVKRIDAVLEGPGGSTLLSVRNNRVIKVLRQELKKGHHHIAIFYGAAHLPDLERKLQGKFGLVCTGVKWLKAWNLSFPNVP